MNKSESIANLATALTQFAAEVHNPKNTASNPFHKNKYTPLNDILSYVRPLLAQHGLSVSQLVHSDDAAIGVTTMLMHTSGEYIADTATMSPGAEKGMSAAQVVGSVVTYLRRYALTAVLGIASEDDDDGNAGLRDSKKANPAPPAKPATPQQDYLGSNINDISPSKYAWALKAEIDWLRANGREQAADDYQEAARQLKEEGAKSADYHDPLIDARKARMKAEDEIGTGAHKSKESTNEQEDMF